MQQTYTVVRSLIEEYNNYKYMPLPSFLNNLSKKQNNLSPNNVASSTPPSENFPTLISAILNRPGMQAPQPQVQQPQQVTQPVVQSQQPVQPSQPMYVPPMDNMEAIRSGNMNNPLNQYSNEFGDYYAQQNMGGYNPVAEYHKLQTEAALNAVQGTGMYSLPENAALAPDQISSIRNSADKYYENQLGMTRGEAQDTMSNLRNTITGGVLGTLPPQTATKVDELRKEYSDDNSTRAMFNIQNTLNQAQGVYEKNKNNAGLANGTDDYRMMFLLSNAMNPNSQVSEGDYANAQEIMGTFPAAVQSRLSAYIQKDNKGNLQLSDMKKGFLTPEGRKAIYDSIQEHYNETTINNEFLRKQKADLIDSYSGRKGLGDYVTRSVINPSNVQSTQSQSDSSNPYAEQW